MGSRNLSCCVDCKYCIVSKTNSKIGEWQNKNLGFNNTSLFIGRFTDDKPLKDLGIDFSLLENEIVGLGIVDCFDKRYLSDLEFITNNLDNFKIRRLLLISKVPISGEALAIIKGKRVTVAYSITGLDKYKIENTTTEDRLKSLEKLVANNTDCLVLIQPYIHNVSDLSFISKLRNIGIKALACKGFTYEKENMKELEHSGIDSSILDLYNNHGKEVLIGEEYVKELCNNNGIEYVDLKEYVCRLVDDKYRLSYEDAVISVNKVISKLDSSITICSSSDSIEEIIAYAIKRRIV